MSLAVQSRREVLLAQIDQLESIPSVEAIIQPLIGYLQQPLEKMDMQRVIDLISHDSSLAAQCLHMANSPLFGRWQSITTTRGAVIALGLQRMRDIAVSCCVLKLLPEAAGSNPVIFWEHSLACALVCRRMAKRIGVKDPEQAYLAGLLHDIGFVVNLWIYPDEFYRLVETASRRSCSVYEVEEECLQLSHCETGKVLARKWDLAPEVAEVISNHHRFSALADYPALTALVNVADRLCRMHGLGYGHEENIGMPWERDEAVEIIRHAWPIARNVNWNGFSSELKSYLKEVKNLVSVLYRFSA